MATPINVMILAAGKGERLRPYTEQVPKPLIPFLGVPMVEFALSQVERLVTDGVITVPNLVVNCHHLADQIEDYFRFKRPLSKKPFWKNLMVSHEPVLLGAAGIKKCYSVLSSTENFLVVNADEVFFTDDKLTSFVSQHLEDKSLATILCTEHPNVGTKLGGVWVDQLHGVIGFGKTPPTIDLSGKHFLGFVLLGKTIFNYFKTPLAEENLLYDVITKSITNGERVDASLIKAEWYETGKVEEFLRAEKELAASAPPGLADFLALNQQFGRQFKTIVV